MATSEQTTEPITFNVAASVFTPEIAKKDDALDSVPAVADQTKEESRKEDVAPTPVKDEAISAPIVSQPAEPTPTKEEAILIPSKEELKKDEMIPVPAKSEAKKKDVNPTPAKEESTKKEVVSTPSKLESGNIEPKKEVSIPTTPAEEVSPETEKKIDSPILKPAPMPTPEVAPVMPEPTKKEISTPPSPVSINLAAGPSAIKGGVDTLLALATEVVQVAAASTAAPVVASKGVEGSADVQTSVTEVIHSTRIDAEGVEQHITTETTTITEKIADFVEDVEETLAIVGHDVAVGAEHIVAAIEAHPELIAEGVLAVVVGAASLVQPEFIAGEIAIVGKMASDAAKKSAVKIVGDEAALIVRSIAHDVKEDAAKDIAAVEAKGKEAIESAGESVAVSAAAVEEVEDQISKKVNTLEEKVEAKEKASAPAAGNHVVTVNLRQETPQIDADGDGINDIPEAPPVSLKITIGADGTVKAITQTVTIDPLTSDETLAEKVVPGAETSDTKKDTVVDAKTITAAPVAETPKVETKAIEESPVPIIVEKLNKIDNSKERIEDEVKTEPLDEKSVVPEPETINQEVAAPKSIKEGIKEISTPVVESSILASVPAPTIQEREIKPEILPIPLKNEKDVEDEVPNELSLIEETKSEPVVEKFVAHLVANELTLPKLETPLEAQVAIVETIPEVKQILSKLEDSQSDSPLLGAGEPVIGTKEVESSPEESKTEIVEPEPILTKGVQTSEAISELPASVLTQEPIVTPQLYEFPKSVLKDIGIPHEILDSTAGNPVDASESIASPKEIESIPVVEQEEAAAKPEEVTEVAPVPKESKSEIVEPVSTKEVRETEAPVQESPSPISVQEPTVPKSDEEPKSVLKEIGIPHEPVPVSESIKEIPIESKSEPIESAKELPVQEVLDAKPLLVLPTPLQSTKEAKEDSQRTPVKSAKDVTEEKIPEPETTQPVLSTPFESEDEILVTPESKPVELAKDISKEDISELEFTPAALPTLESQDEIPETLESKPVESAKDISEEKIPEPAATLTALPILQSKNEIPQSLKSIPAESTKDISEEKVSEPKLTLAVSSILESKDEISVSSESRPTESAQDIPEENISGPDAILAASPILESKDKIPESLEIKPAESANDLPLELASEAEPIPAELPATIPHVEVISTEPEDLSAELPVTVQHVEEIAAAPEDLPAEEALKSDDLPIEASIRDLPADIDSIPAQGPAQSTEVLSIEETLKADVALIEPVEPSTLSKFVETLPQESVPSPEPSPLEKSQDLPTEENSKLDVTPIQPSISSESVKDLPEETVPIPEPASESLESVSTEETLKAEAAPIEPSTLSETLKDLPQAIVSVPEAVAPTEIASSEPNADLPIYEALKSDIAPIEGPTSAESTKDLLQEIVSTPEPVAPTTANAPLVENTSSEPEEPAVPTLWSNSSHVSVSKDSLKSTHSNTALPVPVAEPSSSQEIATEPVFAKEDEPIVSLLTSAPELAIPETSKSVDTSAQPIAPAEEMITPPSEQSSAAESSATPTTLEPPTRKKHEKKVSIISSIGKFFWPWGGGNSKSKDAAVDTPAPAETTAPAA